MSMDKHNKDPYRCMTPDEAFAITLLVTCEVTKNILTDRAGGDKERLYWLDRMCTAIEGVNRTYGGYLPDGFRNAADKYHKMIEVDMNNLLKSFRQE